MQIQNKLPTIVPFFRVRLQFVCWMWRRASGCRSALSSRCNHTTPTMVSSHPLNIRKVEYPRFLVLAMFAVCHRLAHTPLSRYANLFGRKSLEKHIRSHIFARLLCDLCTHTQTIETSTWANKILQTPNISFEWTNDHMTVVVDMFAVVERLAVAPLTHTFDYFVIILRCPATKMASTFNTIALGFVCFFSRSLQFSELQTPVHDHFSQRSWSHRRL